MIDNDQIQAMLDKGMTRAAIEAEIERQGGHTVESGTGADLHLVTAEDVEIVTAAANEGAEEMLISVWVPLATNVAKGVYNDFDVVLLHVVAADPQTGDEGAFVLVLGREEALDLRDKLNSVGATVSPIKAQVKRRSAAINSEEK